MANLVQVKYDEFDQVAAMFAQEANRTEEMAGRVKAAVENMRDKWIGVGADAFFQEMDSLVMPGVNRLSEALNQGAQRSKQIAQVFHQNEGDASNLFGKG